MRRFRRRNAPLASPIDAAACRSGLPNRSKRLRDASDRLLAKTGARPRIFLANLGTPADFTRARDLRQELFRGRRHRGGRRRGPDVRAAPAAFRLRRALACLCSSDKVYDKEARDAAQALKAAGARHIYLAGRPGDAEAALRGRRRSIVHLRGLRRPGDTAGALTIFSVSNDRVKDG